MPQLCPETLPASPRWGNKECAAMATPGTSGGPPAPRSAVDQLIARSPHLIHKLSATDTTGRRAYYFVYIPANREAAFTEALKQPQTIQLEDYGKVIASCYGDAPTEEIRQFLKDKYGFDV
jgi:hypothetical protein